LLVPVDARFLDVVKSLPEPGVVEDGKDGKDGKGVKVELCCRSLE